MQQGAGLNGGSSSLLLRKVSLTRTPKTTERVLRGPWILLFIYLLSTGWAPECWQLCSLLHGVSFTLSKIARWGEAAPEKTRRLSVSQIKACSQMPSCGSQHTLDHCDYPIVKSYWANGQMVLLPPSSLTMFCLICQLEAFKNSWDR